ncbi:1,2-phenylacetyl-CoA epoxidase subunit PaaE [Actinomadura madurae]|uniref:1,2-phenylacetyl-CoA epoxidase subunit PaaE n=1 Tax=Actinomadura madurae TaxID=1993 RepID=UPI0020266A84|nr:1,2-phenylacetyl-CoA epoxidase subunit PaaE [Actinomadura madurae]MCP9952554.1 phenylacetate-CoA oxygenase/reductase subunit PaaK [Actinomadura madurae]MCP9969314.1 phenylacetate-CoA oxygenase/reductase subunit PaaK [Actinomadura madurae]MCP9981785.1 phenylacetate-CoA oxygenase/reductase subunit PaaK [Actinomadura madurae]MCQ0006697.1 phenylacetate-CoA oxygenase/reductase subunit PaaK [Actinomadura madurae]URN08755.1 phenylacetate-CoA oxygenase/reductase subunit PaaK [Actinomadura madurae]
MTLTEVAPRRAGFHALRVADVEPLCDDAVAVTFDVPPELADAYAFRPGQFLTLRRVLDGREERRSYSICAPAGAAPRIGVREIPAGLFSSWLVHEVRAGDVVEVLPPSGTFVLDAPGAEHHVLIAAGSGITPVMSIAASALADPAARVTVLYGNRRSGTVMFADELADLKDAHPDRFELVHVLSQEPREAELFSGRLDADRLRALLPLLVPVADVGHWWLCGPFGMVTGARDVLRGFGVPRERVHQELFHVDEVPPEPNRTRSAPSGPASEVTIVLDGRSTTLTQPRDATVLDSAQRVRPDLPFACKGGVCGTCRARVVEGAAGMRRNFALDPAEVDAGYVLTCQSVPVTPELTVDYDA